MRNNLLIALSLLAGSIFFTSAYALEKAQENPTSQDKCDVSKIDSCL